MIVADYVLQPYERLVLGIDPAQGENEPLCVVTAIYDSLSKQLCIVDVEMNV